MDLSRISDAALERQLAEFVKAGQKSQRIKACAVWLVDRKSNGTLRMRFQFVGQQVGYIHGHSAIEAGVGSAVGMMVVGDGLNGQVGQSPQAEQIGANLGVRSAEQLLFSQKNRASFFGGGGGMSTSGLLPCKIAMAWTRRSRLTFQDCA